MNEDIVQKMASWAGVARKDILRVISQSMRLDEYHFAWTQFDSYSVAAKIYTGESEPLIELRGWHNASRGAYNIDTQDADETESIKNEIMQMELEK